MELDLTITISVILALSAIISPIATTIINNCHQTKIKKLELRQAEYEHNVLYRCKIFENYTKSLHDACQTSTPVALSEYAKCYSLAFMYLPDNIRQKMSCVNSLISRLEFELALSSTDEIIKDVSAYTESLLAQRK